MPRQINGKPERDACAEVISWGTSGAGYVSTPLEPKVIGLERVAGLHHRISQQGAPRPRVARYAFETHLVDEPYWVW